MFNSNDFFKFIPKKYSVEGIPFSLIALTDELCEKVSACETHEKMISLAADYGLACDNVRVVDDEELATHISRLWEAPEVKIECDPSVKHQVGLKVCEISGLSEVLAEQLELEALAAEEKAEAERVEALKEQGHIDGDSDTPLVLVDELNEDANAAIQN